LGVPPSIGVAGWQLLLTAFSAAYHVMAVTHFSTLRTLAPLLFFVCCVGSLRTCQHPSCCKLLLTCHRHVLAPLSWCQCLRGFSKLYSFPTHSGSICCGREQRGCGGFCSRCCNCFGGQQGHRGRFRALHTHRCRCPNLLCPGTFCSCTHMAKPALWHMSQLVTWLAC
jgi:hypothetical protein